MRGKMRCRVKKKSLKKQLEFFGELKMPRFFGGSLRKSNPKAKRPLSKRESVHLVLKSARAIGPKSMLQKRNADRIDTLFRKHAKLCGIKIYHFVNVGNHLHLVIRIHDRKLFTRFIRAVTGLIARHVLNQERGLGRRNTEQPVKAKERDEDKSRFWVARPFTRLIAWGKDFKIVGQYMIKNRSLAKRSQANRSFVAWGFDVTDPGRIQSLNTA